MTTSWIAVSGAAFIGYAFNSALQTCTLMANCSEFCSVQPQTELPYTKFTDTSIRDPSCVQCTFHVHHFRDRCWMCSCFADASSNTRYRRLGSVRLRPNRGVVRCAFNDIDLVRSHMLATCLMEVLLIELQALGVVYLQRFTLRLHKGVLPRRPSTTAMTTQL